MRTEILATEAFQQVVDSIPELQSFEIMPSKIITLRGENYPIGSSVEFVAHSGKKFTIPLAEYPETPEYVSASGIEGAIQFVRDVLKKREG